MGNIGTGFCFSIQTVEPGVMAVPETLLLWKDIPYPMTAFTTLLQLAQGLRINEVVSISEALQIVLFLLSLRIHLEGKYHSITAPI